MKSDDIQIIRTPELEHPVLIAGFGGWGNAMDVPSYLLEYLIRKLGGQEFARIHPERFFRYDENRPGVMIEGGTVKRFEPPGGAFYAVVPDLVMMKCDEPSLNWYGFTDAFFDLCDRLKVRLVITLGSMYDNVLHSECLISGAATNDELFELLRQKDVAPIYYEGPGAIHSIIQYQGARQGRPCVSLWGHCPYYIEGVAHYGMVMALAALVADICGFDLDMKDLESKWEKLNDQIEKLIQQNDRLSEIVTELKQIRQSSKSPRIRPSTKGQKVINITDYLNPV